MSTIPTSALPVSPRLFAAAPHRLLFFVGAANVLAAMTWWALWLVAARWPTLLPMPQPPLPAGWAHAIVMPYQVLAPFVFGFLLTVFPRWMGVPELSRWHYLPVGIGLLGGQIATLIGLWGHAQLVHVGLLFTLAGWTAGLVFLIVVKRKETATTWHAVSCLAALTLGWLGLVAFLGWLHGGSALLAFAAIKLGTLGFALPIYFTVCHRMIPFFASCALPGYRQWKPLSWLAAFWGLLAVHIALELVHAYRWLWLVDVPLAVLAAVLLLRWWPRQRMPGLLAVLFVGFAWLPVAFSLFALQSLWYAFDGAFVLARAPLHALAVGFFGSLLVAMVTRVTQGHSGRPLAMPAVGWFAFGCIQLVALVRIGADIAADGMAWQAIAALGWVLAFLPWALRSLWIVSTPRADGKPG